LSPHFPPPCPPVRVFEGDVLKYPLSSLGQFQGILIDPPLRSPKEPYRVGTITPAEFGKLHITTKIIPNGLIFVWVEKEFIVDVRCSAAQRSSKTPTLLNHLPLASQVVKQLKVWGFLYVENFVWVKKHVNNRIVTEDSAFFRRSKLSLHIFR